MVVRQEEELLGVMLSCATGFTTVCGALVVHSSRLAFLLAPRSLALALGVSTGGMLFFTLADLVPEAQEAFEVVVRKTLMHQQESSDLGETSLLEGYASLLLAGAFSLGAGLVWGVDALCLHFAARAKPSRMSNNPTVLMHDETTQRRGQTLVLRNAAEMTTDELLYKTGTARVAAIATQNIPEGIVICIASSQQRSLGILFACAVALLNATQGLALAGVLAQSSGMRWRAVLWCMLAALGLPLGGLLAWGVVLEATMSAMARAIAYSVTSGMLVGMCVTQQLTVCFNDKSESDSSRVTTSVLSGVLFMASLRMLLAFLCV